MMSVRGHPVWEATGVNPFVPLVNNFVANGVAHGPPAH